MERVSLSASDGPIPSRAPLSDALAGLNGQSGRLKKKGEAEKGKGKGKEEKRITYSERAESRQVQIFKAPKSCVRALAFCCWIVIVGILVDIVAAFIPTSCPDLFASQGGGGSGGRPPNCHLSHLNSPRLLPIDKRHQVAPFSRSFSLVYTSEP